LPPVTMATFPFKLNISFMGSSQVSSFESRVSDSQFKRGPWWKFSIFSIIP
jgi:hypothetical protein